MSSIFENDRLPNWPGLDEAMFEVQNFGAQSGRESMIALDPYGNELFRNTGNEHMVEIPFPYNLIPGSLEGCLLVHNHPVFAPLSIPDLKAAMYQGAAGIMAVMPDGSWDLAQGVRLEEGTVKTLNAATRFSEQVAARIVHAAGGKEYAKTGDYAGAGNLAFLAATNKAGLLVGWKHSYSEEFWQHAQKWVPEVKHGSFRVTGFGLFPDAGEVSK